MPLVPCCPGMLGVGDGLVIGENIGPPKLLLRDMTFKLLNQLFNVFTSGAYVTLPIRFVARDKNINLNQISFSTCENRNKNLIDYEAYTSW